MSREIKFRAWDKHYKRFRDIVLNSPISALNNNEIDERFELTQYTGFRDKNDIEIYEGDIIYYELLDEKMIVKNGEVYIHTYGSTKVLVTCCYLEYLNNEYEFLNSLICEKIQVIGNIYENNDLLEEE